MAIVKICVCWLFLAAYLFFFDFRWPLIPFILPFSIFDGFPEVSSSPVHPSRNYISWFIENYEESILHLCVRWGVRGKEVEDGGWDRGRDRVRRGRRSEVGGGGQAWNKKPRKKKEGREKKEIGGEGKRSREPRKRIDKEWRRKIMENVEKNDVER